MSLLLDTATPRDLKNTYKMSFEVTIQTFSLLFFFESLKLALCNNILNKNIVLSYRMKSQMVFALLIVINAASVRVDS